MSSAASAVSAPPTAGAPSRASSGPAAAWAIPVAIGLVTAAVVWLRLPAHDRGVFWAEDAMEFVTKAVAPGPWSSLFLPYQGYLQFVPRVAAGLVTWLLPVSAWALGVTAAAALVTGAVCALIYIVSADVVAWVPARLLLAAAPALIPLGAWEVAGTLNNLHSVLLCAVPWVLLYRPRSRTGAIVLAIAVCAIVLSETQAGYFLPLLLWHFCERSRWLVRAGYLVGLIAQIVAFVVAPRALPAHAGVAPTSTVIGFFANTVLGVAFSTPARVGNAMAHHSLLVYATAVPILAVAAVCLVLGTWRERLAAVAVGSAAVVLWAVGYNGNLSVTSYPFDGFSPADWLHFGSILRYAFAPAVFLVALVAIAAAILARRGRRLVGGAVVVVMAAIIIAGAAVVAPTSRASGHEWSAEVATATAQCATLPPSTPKQLSATPYGWYATIPCALLR